MKLSTTIQPRADGTVMVHGVNGKDYEFVKNADGIVECEVDDDAVIAQLVSGGHFYPSDSADQEAAMALAIPKVDEADDDDGLDGDVTFGQSDALPAEANTPPARFKPKSKR